MNNSVSEEIKKIHNLTIRKMISLTKKENMDFISPSQIMIIKYLSESKKEVYQKDLGECFPLRKSTICGIVKTMQKNGLIKLTTTENDLRSKRIELTDLSKNINSKIKNSFKKFDEMIIKDIDSSDLEIFFKVCTQIQNNLKGETDDKNI